MSDFQAGLLVGMVLGAYAAWLVGAIVHIYREDKARRRHRTQSTQPKKGDSSHVA